jgi:hypothetical protein
MVRVIATMWNLSKSLLLLLLISLMVSASAFTVDRLDIQVEEYGVAQVDFSHPLPQLEQIAVFLQLAHPAQEFILALEKFIAQPKRMNL